MSVYCKKAVVMLEFGRGKPLLVTTGGKPLLVSLLEVNHYWQEFTRGKPLLAGVYWR